jgi:endonuclease/exonuclease/phosphatase family metal-dependent hydrolase
MFCLNSFASKTAVFIALCHALSAPAVQVPIVNQTNVTVRVMAANLTSGNNQRYETPGLNILKGLKPDIVAMQEFNVTNSFGINTAAALSNMVATTFGTNFIYFRETGAGYTIPNGIISRWPFVSSGSWVDSDTGVNDRGFAWARIDLPGTNDLYVVSVHLKAGNAGGPPSDASRRAAEAAELTSLIQSNFGTNVWLIVAGDMNLYSDTEAAITTFKTYLSDSPVPADQNGDVDTNAGRSGRYDRVLPSFAMTNLLVPVAMPSRNYTNGLVFDSRVYTPLSDVPPVVSTDSGASQMQHMGVVKDFKITYAVTNVVAVDSPVLTFELPGILRWQGVSNLTYTVLASTNLADWDNIGTAASVTSSFSFTNLIGGDAQQFYRVTYP